MVNIYQYALHRLWNGCLDVYIRETVRNSANGRDEPVEIQKIQKQPCHLSFDSLSSIKEDNSAALVQQTAKLFTSKNIKIPPGSKILVTQNGNVKIYQMSGEPAVYSFHQEIMLELFKGWA